MSNPVGVIARALFRSLAANALAASWRAQMEFCREFFGALGDVGRRAAFDRTRFYCVNANCSWQGTGRTVETVDIDGDGRSTDYPHCPRCGDDVDGDPC